MPAALSREFLDEADLAYWKLTADPFDDPVAVGDAWLSPATELLEAAIARAAYGRQILALVGPCGAGKSTLLRRLSGKARLDRKLLLLSPAILDGESITAASLATTILRDLLGRDVSSMGAEPRAELLRQTLAAKVADGLFPVLVIDDAHKLKPRAFLAIKALWDAHLSYRQLGVILAGQPSLGARVGLDDLLAKNPELAEVFGRTRLLRMPTLQERAGDYIRWRFARVGGDADQIFDVGAYKRLGGRAEYPLWVNNLAVAAMRYARTVGDRKITDAHVARAT